MAFILCLSTHPKLTCASAAWFRRAPPVPTGVARALLLFEPFLEPLPLPPTTKVLEPFEELDTRVISVRLLLVTFDIGGILLNKFVFIPGGGHRHGPVLQDRRRRSRRRRKPVTRQCSTWEGVINLSMYMQYALYSATVQSYEELIVKVLIEYEHDSPWRPLTSRLEEEFFILDLTSR